MASERRGHQRLAKFRTFQTTCDLKFFVKVRVVLCTLANILFSYSVLEKAGKAKDLGRYVLAINSEI